MHVMKIIWNLLVLAIAFALMFPWLTLLFGSIVLAVVVAIIDPKLFVLPFIICRYCSFTD